MFIESVRCYIFIFIAESDINKAIIIIESEIISKINNANKIHIIIEIDVEEII